MMVSHPKNQVQNNTVACCGKMRWINFSSIVFSTENSPIENGKLKELTLCIV